MQISKKDLNDLIIAVINITVNNTESSTNGYGVKVNYRKVYKESKKAIKTAVKSKKQNY
jgi:hypothetical protein